MFSPLRGVLALIAMSSLTLFGTPAFAVEPDTDSPAGPELPAPRVRPVFKRTTKPGLLNSCLRSSWLQALLFPITQCRSLRR